MTATVDPSGRLRVGGVDLVDLAEEIGTPLFVYDEAHLRARCREAVEAWGDGVAYATKAFLCKAMARLAHEEGMCLDVSTGGELHVALSAGVPRRPAGAPRQQQVRRGAGRGAGGRRGPDRRRLLRRDRPARASASPSGRRAVDDRPPARPKVLARITPGVEVHTHEFVRTGQDDSKFGFGLASGAAGRAVDRLVELACRGRRRVRGDPRPPRAARSSPSAPFAQAIEVLAEFFAPLGLPELVVGGGLGVAYVNGEEAPPDGPVGRVGAPGLPAGRASPTRSGSPPSPGGPSWPRPAITLYRVGTIKDVPGHRTYVSVDGGMSDNPRPVLYGSGYEAFLPRETGAARPVPVRVVGKHCETGDVVVSEGFVPDDLAVGDILATPVTGAYGHSMASNYNKVPRPAVVFVADGERRVVVRRETLRRPGPPRRLTAAVPASGQAVA